MIDSTKTQIISKLQIKISTKKNGPSQLQAYSLFTTTYRLFMDSFRRRTRFISLLLSLPISFRPLLLLLKPLLQVLKSINPIIISPKTSSFIYIFLQSLQPVNHARKKSDMLENL